MNIFFSSFKDRNRKLQNPINFISRVHSTYSHAPARYIKVGSDIHIHMRPLVIHVMYVLYFTKIRTHLTITHTMHGLLNRWRRIGLFRGFRIKTGWLLVDKNSEKINLIYNFKKSNLDVSNEGSNFILSSLEVDHWVAQTWPFLTNYLKLQILASYNNLRIGQDSEVLTIFCINCDSN